MGVSVFPAASAGMTTTRFPARIGNPFQIPAGLTLMNTVTSTTTFSAGSLPAQVWAVIIGGGGGGAGDGTNGGGGGGGSCIGWVDVPSDGITATIGAGGSGGTSAGWNGSPGGQTTFGSHIAWGGGGGFGGGVSNTDMFDSNAHPRGEGAGWGGVNSNQAAGQGRVRQAPANCSPFIYGISANGLTEGNSYHPRFTGTIANWNGGGYGGAVNMNYPSNYIGGHGLTGGGGAGEGSTYGVGGSSSRNGGITYTFTGANGSSSNIAAGGGAGLLANGSVPSSTIGGAGGSGGGGGGTGSNAAAGGAGGNGCVLIYY